MPNLSNVNPILTGHLKTKTEKARLRLFAKLTQKEIAGQIRQLREKRQLTQIQFAKLCKMGQPAVSRIEQASYSGWTYKTLARVAEKLNARLRIIYEPLEEVIARMDADRKLVAEVNAESARKEAVAEVDYVQPPVSGQPVASDDEEEPPSIAEVIREPEARRDPWSFDSLQKLKDDQAENLIQ